MSERTGIHEWVATLSESERASLMAAERELQRVPVQGSSEDIFEAIARFVPVAGGLIGTLGTERATSPVSHVIKLPPAVLEGWASTPREHLGRMLAPMVEARPGELVSDSQAIIEPFREQLGLLRDLRDAGLGESAGYKVSTRPAASGGVEHRFMTFALHRGETFTERDRAALAFLQPIIHAALDRLRVPLIASESILSQVVDDRSKGFMCVSRHGRIVEVNQLMHALVIRYLAAARVEGGRGALSRFAERAMAETGGGRIWQLWHGDGRALAQVSCHWLAKETHAIGEDLLLVMMNEVIFAPPPPTPVSAKLAALTIRQREIALLLVGTGQSLKQIAADLRIEVRTVEKHVEHIFRSMRVHSRPELVTKLR